jgi:hypothetical protein
VPLCAHQAQLTEAEDQLQQAAKDKLQVQLELSQAQVSGGRRRQGAAALLTCGVQDAALLSTVARCCNQGLTDLYGCLIVLLLLLPSQAEEDEYAYTLIQLQQLYHHCKELLATATQQKVEALLQVANQEAKALAEQPLLPTSVPKQQQQQQQQRNGQLPHSPSSSTASPTAQQQQPVGVSLLPPRADAAECAALPPAAEQQQQQQSDVLPVSTSPHSGDTPTDQHSLCRTQQQQAQQQSVEQVSQALRNLLLLTHHYLSLLRQLPPADIAAAANGTSSSGSGSKGQGAGKKSAGGPAAVAAGADPLAQLAAAAHGLERDKQQLLSSSHLKQQQLEEILSGLLQHHPSAATAAAGAASAASSRSPAHSHSGAGTLASLGKLLKAHGSPGSSVGTAPSEPAPPAAPPGDAEGLVETSALIQSLCTYAAEDVSSAGSSRQLPLAPSPGVMLSCTADSLGPGDTGLGSADAAPAAGAPAGAIDELKGVAELQVALCHEVQLLAECGLSALRYIPKLTALSSLMQGSW